jgi:hypothetical protein
MELYSQMKIKNTTYLKKKLQLSIWLWSYTTVQKFKSQFLQKITNISGLFNY